MEEPALCHSRALQKESKDGFIFLIAVNMVVNDLKKKQNPDTQTATFKPQPKTIYHLYKNKILKKNKKLM